jgi:quercetin dioxygenase-like cupin family protein
MTQELAGRDGNEGTMIMVEYAPGGSDAAHRHNAHVFVYALGNQIMNRMSEPCVG